ncbi:MAG TPA: GlsB/YeaQ/YmgE family stress response membrane protein [Longimicrobiales bacterium]|nr:GlsB/YeaQ/YmgE family stress response membrane protein [Longimicrobiales bacterium]
MNIIAWIIFGLIAGGLAKFIMPGKDPGGCIVTMVIGIVGALIGGFIGRALLGRSASPAFDLVSLLLAVLGAVILLAIYRAFVGRRRRI